MRAWVVAKPGPITSGPTPYPFSRAGQALADLKASRVDGAAVLQL